MAGSVSLGLASLWAFLPACFVSLEDCAVWRGFWGLRFCACVARKSSRKALCAFGIPPEGTKQDQKRNMTNADYPQNTPELARLWAELQAANQALQAKVNECMRSGKAPGIASRVQLPEYVAAKAAYKAYWAAVDKGRP